MKTEIIKDQKWAITGHYGCYELREGFWIHSDIGAIDAPHAIPSGSTRENIVAGHPHMEDVRCVIGGTVWVR